MDVPFHTRPAPQVAPKEYELPDPDAVLRVVAAEPRFVVVDKPAWLLAVPGKGADKQDCVAARVAAIFPRATGPLVVHRLDMETSGLMVLGLDPDAQRDLSRQFEDRSVEKRYTSLVDGIVEEDEGLINLPMRPDIERRPYQIVDRDLGREAVTRWRVVSREVDRTRVEFRPRTGRTHQLRVHAATAREVGGLGHAIVGDGLYGGSEAGTPNRPLRDWGPPPRLMLHAAYLSFIAPGSARRVEFESAAPF